MSEVPNPLPGAEKDACPRCGHNEPRDLTRLPNGDHLVMEEGPLELGQRPDTPTNSFIFTATRDVRFVWCSTRVLPPGPGAPSERGGDR